jgi:conjugal transfer pilus assembly protein TraU
MNATHQWWRWLAALLAGWMMFAPAWAAPTCPGKFPNPITDICWSCMMPLTLGGAKLLALDQEDNGNNPGDAICGCANPPRVGISTGFWEPVRIAEVVRHPYCFPTLGGLSMDLGIHAPAHGRGKGTHDSHGSSFYQAHWYVFPVLYVLEVLLESNCLEPGGFDIAYITEVDPLWNESELTFILNPDVALFANPVAQAVCAADCVAATAGFPLSELYWCAGCQGSLYPLNGNVAAHIGGVQASTLITQRMTAKMHRELLVWGASGDRGQCGYYPQPVMDKRNYKMTMLHPIPQTKKIDGKCCQPYGRTTAIWGAGREFPYQGEDFAYLIFRKRNCCASVFSAASLAP